MERAQGRAAGDYDTATFFYRANQLNTEQQHWYGTGRANIIENRREERAPEFDESCKRAFFYPNISLENKSGFLRYFFSISVFNILVIFLVTYSQISAPRPPPTLTAFCDVLSGSCIFAIRDVVVFYCSWKESQYQISPQFPENSKMLKSI